MISISLFIKQRKYFSSAFLFFCFSLIFSTWVTYIPHIAEKIGITEGKIGGAIFFASLGSFIMIPIANRLVDRVGVGRLTYIALLVYCATLFGPFLADNYTSLCAALFILGMASSCYGISVNTLTATIEIQDKVYIMSGSHGFWSIGGVVGAAGGSLLASKLNNPLLHVAIVVSLIAGLQTWLRAYYKYRRSEHITKQKLSFNQLKPLFIIALLGLILMVAEGAIADWGALYLRKIIHFPLQYVGMGYASFSFAMMIGRFFGDTLSRKLGSWQLLSYTSLLSIFGFILVLIINPAVSLTGFFIIGLGFSVIVPEVFRLASKTEGIKTTDGVSFIAATTNIGFLAGPVLLGFIAEFKSLHFSFVVLTVFVCLAFIISTIKNRQAAKS